MRRAIISCALLGTWMFFAAESVAQITFSQNQSQSVAPVAYNDSYSQPAVEASPSDWSTSYVSARLDDQSCVQTSCCCNEATCGCESGCCGCGNDCGLLDDCCLGDAWTLHDELHPCSDHNYGGWIALGYHNKYTRQAQPPPREEWAFNNRPHEVNLHQAWVYFEKLAEAGCCSSDWGYRVDVMYGIDSQKIQSFGNPGGSWDVTFDNGVYGWAIPQAYGEYATGDWSVKMGRFFTLIGYEVVPAPQNFFYSRSLTMYNSEPFGHTGVLGSYEVNCDLTIHTGWTLGWDTGFNQLGGGSNWLGGFSYALSNDATLHYISTAGDLGWRGEGYSQSLVLDVELNNCMRYILQSDYVNTENAPAGIGIASVTDNEDLGINQYLIYTLNECWAVGGRMEWWKSNAITGESASFYELTGGVNYRPHANVVIRPEIRYDWTPSENAVGFGYNQAVFGIDAILTF